MFAVDFLKAIASRKSLLFYCLTKNFIKMKNLKLTNLEKRQENEMAQVRGGLFGMGKKYLKVGKKLHLCHGTCATTSNQYTGRSDHGNNDRDNNN